MTNIQEASPWDLADGMAQAARTAGTTDPQIHGADWQTAVVTAVGTDGTVDIGNVRARRLDTYVNPSVGDLIAVTQNGTKNWLALGRTAPTVDATFTAWTPTVANAGTATFGTREGWYTRVATKVVFFHAYITLTAVGSGTSGVTVSLPTVPWRGAANRRQRVGCYGAAIAVGSNSSISGHFQGLVLAGGSGAVFDQLRGPTDIQLLGTNLGASTILTIEGTYREA
jgi:hypothetical protein